MRTKSLTLGIPQCFLLYLARAFFLWLPAWITPTILSFYQTVLPRLPCPALLIRSFWISLCISPQSWLSSDRNTCAYYLFLPQDSQPDFHPFNQLSSVDSFPWVRWLGCRPHLCCLEAYELEKQMFNNSANIYWVSVGCQVLRKTLAIKPLNKMHGQNPGLVCPLWR